MIRLFVPGVPAPQGSKRHLGNGVMVESSKAVKPWRVDVAWAARAAFAERIDGPAAVELEFVMPRPKSTPKRSTPPAIKRPDIDKLERAILDALSGVAYRDDSQVVELVARKRIAELDERSGVWIVVGPASVPDALTGEVAAVLAAHPWVEDGCAACGTAGEPCDVRARVWDAIEAER